MKIKKIILSLLTVVGVGALVIGASQAFFSDTETSTGNTFVAGAIDLKIDNSSYGFDWNDPNVTTPSGVWGPNSANSWQSTDLTNQKFFSFDDLKPGDYGEDTISLEVNNNDAYACMAFDLTGTPENGQNEPEAAVDLTAGADEGELQNYLSFLFWYDDGDNVLEVGETVIEDLSGLPGAAFTGGWMAIAEGGDTPLPANTTTFIGKGWCFGEMTTEPVVQDGVNTNPPTAVRTGFTCSGEGDHNDAQTDGIVVDVAFHAVQSRNNSDFLCSQLPAFDGGEGQNRLVLENKNPENFADVYTGDGRSAVLTWAGDGPTFDFSSTLVGQGLTPSTKYSLIYYADPWPGNFPGAFIGAGTSDGTGNLVISGNPNLGTDIPNATDANHASGGGKIWLVLASDYNGGAESTGPITGWNPTQYLFETELILYEDTDN